MLVIRITFKGEHRIMSSVTRGSLAAAITLALGVSHAHATNFDVTNTNDSGAGSLRQALIDAAADSNIPHTINLAAIAGQTINTTSTLQFSPSGIDMDLSIVGSDVTVAGDGSGSVFDFSSDSNDYILDISISDLTVTGGQAANIGGGIAFEGYAKYDPISLTLDRVTVTGNTSASVGGGIGMYGGILSLNDSTITSNTAGTGGGIFHYGLDLLVSGSLIASNTAEDSGGGLGNLDTDRFAWAQTLTERGLGGGGTAAGIFGLMDFSVSINDSTISGNYSDGFAGGALLLGYDGVSIARSTISDNEAAYDIGGIYAIGGYGPAVCDSTTISGNSAGFVGGGALISEYDRATMNNCTVSGNTASGEIGGIALVGQFYAPEANFSTIVNNTSGSGVGGMLMFGGGQSPEDRGFSYDPAVNTSIIAGNLADGVASDLASEFQAVNIERFNLLGQNEDGSSKRGFGSGNINVNYTLLGSLSLSLTLDAVSQDLLGQNPLLGPLADNGGPTLTHLPGADSPALNVVPGGTLGCGTTFTTDQRGDPRPIDDGCDLGAAEIQGTAAPLPPALPVPVGNAIGMLLLGGLLGLAGMLGLRRRRVDS
jgi:hypothetical protein